MPLCFVPQGAAMVIVPLVLSIHRVTCTVQDSGDVVEIFRHELYMSRVVQVVRVMNRINLSRAIQ